jgi:hypothetical protein
MVNKLKTYIPVYIKHDITEILLKVLKNGKNMMMAGREMHSMSMPVI